MILGAGYDDRALRFRSPGVRYFELDHPATQVDKLRRLTGMHADFGRLTLVPIDFRTDDVGAVLAARGHDADRASLFMCEGVLVYLDQATTVGLLRSVQGRAHDPASRLAVSVAIHADGADTGAVVARANAVRRNAATEPWQTILPASAQRDLLAGVAGRLMTPWTTRRSTAVPTLGGLCSSWPVPPPGGEGQR